jgi:hypothetical protein
VRGRVRHGRRKFGKLAGERRVFRAGVGVHGAAMALMAISTDVVLARKAAEG